jgi:hypothetical protein
MLPAASALLLKRRALQTARDAAVALVGLRALRAATALRAAAPARAPPIGAAPRALGFCLRAPAAMGRELSMRGGAKAAAQAGRPRSHEPGGEPPPAAAAQATAGDPSTLRPDASQCIRPPPARC